MTTDRQGWTRRRIGVLLAPISALSLAGLMLAGQGTLMVASAAPPAAHTNPGHGASNGNGHENKAGDGGAAGTGATTGATNTSGNTSGAPTTGAPAGGSPTAGSSTTGTGGAPSASGGTVITSSVTVSSTTLNAPTGTETGVGAGDKGGNGNSGGGGGNFGHVWLQTTGPCPDKNAEVLNHDPNAMDGCNNLPTVSGVNEIGTVEDDSPAHTPHLPCANIEVMGSKMRDASGDYTIDSIPPSGAHTQVYGFTAPDPVDHSTTDDALPAGMVIGDPTISNNGDWKYDSSKGANPGDHQVMDVIDVGALVHNAIAAGADAHPVQGYHFKLQFVQAPQKHKTFWVKCNLPAPPPPPATDCDNDTDGSSPATDAACGTPTTDCDHDTDGSSPATDAACATPTPTTDCDNDTDNSAATETACGTGGVQGLDCDGNNDSSPTTAADCNQSGTPDCKGVMGGHATAADCDPGVPDCMGVKGGHATAADCDPHHQSVLGAATTMPNTGHADWIRQLIVGILLIVLGSVVLFFGVVPLRRQQA